MRRILYSVGVTLGLLRLWDVPFTTSVWRLLIYVCATYPLQRLCDVCLFMFVRRILYNVCVTFAYLRLCDGSLTTFVWRLVIYVCVTYPYNVCASFSHLRLCDVSFTTFVWRLVSYVCVTYSSVCRLAWGDDLHRLLIFLHACLESVSGGGKLSLQPTPLNLPVYGRSVGPWHTSKLGSILRWHLDVR